MLQIPCRQSTLYIFENDGKMDGVEDSENTPIDTEPGQVNPIVLSDENAHLREDKIGLVSTE